MKCLFFSHFMIWNCRPLTLKSWHFEASEDIMTKFRLQALHIKRIKYWNAGGSGSPPSFNPALLNIVILLHKQATRTKHFDGQCIYISCRIYCFSLYLDFSFIIEFQFYRIALFYQDCPFALAKYLVYLHFESQIVGKKKLNLTFTLYACIIQREYIAGM